MKNQWSQFPFVLRRKILLTFLAGIASIAVSLVTVSYTHLVEPAMHTLTPYRMQAIRK